MSVVSSVIPKITTAAKKFSGKPLGVMSKAIAVATCASVLYDTHINGRERAYSLDEVESGDRFYNQFKQFMTSDRESATICKLKKIWYNLQQDFPFYHITSKTKGYFAGAGNTLLKSLPLIGLSAIALKFKKAGKVAGILLGINAIQALLCDVMGIDFKKPERRY